MTRSRVRDVVDYALYSAYDAAEETKKKHPEFKELYVDVYNFYLNSLLPCLKGREGYFEVMWFFGIHRLLDGSFTLAYMGYYHEAIMILRHIVELITQSYLFKKEVVSKKTIKGEDAAFKFRMFNELDYLEPNEKSKMKYVYSELSKYVHPTLEVMRWESMSYLIHEYDEKALIDFLRFAISVSDFVIATAISVWPEAKTKMKKEKKRLKKYGFKMSLKKID